jgi:hypothetical protein
MEILGIRLGKIEANKDNDRQITGVDIDIRIENVEAKNGTATISFAYTATYRPDIGIMKIGGSLFLSDTPQNSKKLADEWKAKKLLNREITEPVLNLINATASVNGVLISRAINLSPPLVPPKIQLTAADK